MRNIETVFKERHLNSVVVNDGGYSDEIEHFFAEHFDDPMGLFLRDIAPRIVSARETPPKPIDVDRRFLVQFLYNYMRRTPETLTNSQVDDIYEGVIADVGQKVHLQRPDLQDDFDRLKSDPTRRKTLVHNARALSLRQQSTKLLNLLDTYRLVFAVPERVKHSFIVGSVPYARLTNNQDSNLVSGDVELWAPISPKLAVGLVKKDIEGSIIVLPPSSVRKLNEVIFRGSMAAASCSEKLLASLHSKVN